MIYNLLHLGRRVAIGATAGVLLTPVVAPAVLGVVGLSAAGPVAGMSPPPPTYM